VVLLAGLTSALSPVACCGNARLCESQVQHDAGRHLQQWKVRDSKKHRQQNKQTAVTRYSKALMATADDHGHVERGRSNQQTFCKLVVWKNQAKLQRLLQFDFMPNGRLANLKPISDRYCSVHWSTAGCSNSCCALQNREAHTVYRLEAEG
jgi:hypothetical protein